MMFAQTEHLTLRAYRDSDLDLLHALWNDPQVQRTGTNESVVPRTPKWARDTLPAQIETSLLHVIVEVTDPSAHGEDNGAAAKGAEMEDGARASGLRFGADANKYAEDEKFVGYCLLQMPNAKNRDAGLAIALLPRWWGRGFGTEVVHWIVDYGFENLGLHRISLAVMDGNDRAVSLYKKLYVNIWIIRGVLGFITDIAVSLPVGLWSKDASESATGWRMGGRTSLRWAC